MSSCNAAHYINWATVFACKWGDPNSGQAIKTVSTIEREQLEVDFAKRVLWDLINRGVWGLHFWDELFKRKLVSLPFFRVSLFELFEHGLSKKW